MPTRAHPKTAPSGCTRGRQPRTEVYSQGSILGGHPKGAQYLIAQEGLRSKRAGAVALATCSSRKSCKRGVLGEGRSARLSASFVEPQRRLGDK